MQVFLLKDISYLGKPKARENAEDLGADGSITLRWMSKKHGMRFQTGCIWFRRKTSRWPFQA